MYLQMPSNRNVEYIQIFFSLEPMFEYLNIKFQETEEKTKDLHTFR